MPPIVGRPSALCSLLLIVSTGNTGIHIATPALAPATVTALRLNSPCGFPETGSLGVIVRFMYSYVAKYAAEPGPSLARVMAEPLNTLLRPPSLYNCRTTSMPPLYFGFSPGPNCFWPWIWRRTLTRSKGAVMSVMGIAEKKPAVETWAMLNGVSAEVCGEKERTRVLPTS